MKSLVYCACILVLASSGLAELKQQVQDAITEKQVQADVEACMNENNMDTNDWYTKEEIMSGLHDEPENEERKRKNGCAIECIMRKSHMMEGSNIKEGEILADINKEVKDNATKHIVLNIVHKCLKKARDVTHECEKGSSLLFCIVTAIEEVNEENIKLKEEDMREIDALLQEVAEELIREIGEAIEKAMEGAIGEATEETIAEEVGEAAEEAGQAE